MSKKTYNAKVNENLDFEGLDPSTLDFVPVGLGRFHILHQNQSFTAEVVSTNFQEKTFQIKVNGSTYHVRLADQYDQLIKIKF